MSNFVVDEDIKPEDPFFEYIYGNFFEKLCNDRERFLRDAFKEVFNKDVDDVNKDLLQKIVFLRHNRTIYYYNEIPFCEEYVITKKNLYNVKFRIIE